MQTKIVGTIINKARQGDVYLLKQETPINAIFSCQQQTILAYGEVTGHKHEVLPMPGETTMIAIANIDGKNFLRVTGGNAFIKHEEHHHIIIPPGDYEYRIQREFDPVEEQRKVRD